MDLDLGRLTVIVGPSSSGKSALMRALKAIASNVRGSGNITRGQKLTAITVRTGEQSITLERAEANGCYRLIDNDGAEQIFTKLNGGVPEHITKALRIEPVPTNGTSVNFAGQFDRPYLLDETGANVARVLGELTNVNVIFEAVRQANKTRANAASTLKTRQSDLADLRARLGAFQGLSDRLDALDEASELIQQGDDLQGRVDRLHAAAATLDLAEKVYARTQQLPDVPDGSPAYAQMQKITAFTDLLRTIAVHSAKITTMTGLVSHNALEQQELYTEHADILRAAGQCPTCGQTTTERP